jgi:hypothetical protein
MKKSNFIKPPDDFLQIAADLSEKTFPTFAEVEYIPSLENTKKWHEINPAQALGRAKRENVVEQAIGILGPNAGNHDLEPKRKFIGVIGHIDHGKSTLTAALELALMKNGSAVIVKNDELDDFEVVNNWEVKDVLRKMIDDGKINIIEPRPMPPRPSFSDMVYEPKEKKNIKSYHKIREEIVFTPYPEKPIPAGCQKYFFANGFETVAISQKSANKKYQKSLKNKK